MSVRKHSNQSNAGFRQRVFDFNTRNRYLREPFVGDAHAKHALRVLSDFAGDACDCWPSKQLIGRAMEASKRTVDKAMDHLVRQALIIVFPPTRGRKSNTYRLRWAEIAERSDQAKRHHQEAGEGCTVCTPGVQDMHPTGARRAPEAYREAFNEASTPQPPKPSKRRAGEKPASRLPDEWQGVVVDLLDYGVLDPEPAVAKARQRDCTPQLVRQAIDFARSRVTADGIRAWEGGALRKRVMNLVPGQSIDDETLWLPKSDAYQAARRREAEQRRRAEEARHEAGRREESQRQRQQLSELEAEFGDVLDSLTDPQCDDLAVEALGGRDNFQFRLYRRQGRSAASVRPDLLRVLSARKEVQK